MELVVMIFGIICLAALGSLLGALLLRFIAKIICKVLLKYDEAYITSFFVMAISNLPLTFIMIQRDIEPGFALSYYSFFCLPVKIIVPMIIYKKRIKNPDTGEITWANAFLISLFFLIMNILIFVILMFR